MVKIELNEIRVTDLGMAEDCEYRFLMRQESKPGKENVRLFMGKVFHSALEFYCRHKAETGEHMDWITLRNEMQVIFAGMRDNVDFSTIAVEKAGNIVQQYLNTYYKERCKLLYPGKIDGVPVIERRFYVKAFLGKEVITITGKVDLLLNSMIIADHKTSASLEVWSQARADHEVQPQMYQYLAKKNGIDVRGFMYNIVSPLGCKAINVAYNEERVQEILKYAFELKQALKQGNTNYSTSKMVCNMCEFKSKCDRRRD